MFINSPRWDLLLFSAQAEPCVKAAPRCPPPPLEPKATKPSLRCSTSTAMTKSYRGSSSSSSSSSTIRLRIPVNLFQNLSEPTTSLALSGTAQVPGSPRLRFHRALFSAFDACAAAREELQLAGEDCRAWNAICGEDWPRLSERHDVDAAELSNQRVRAAEAYYDAAWTTMRAWKVCRAVFDEWVAEDHGQRGSQAAVEELLQRLYREDKADVKRAKPYLRMAEDYRAGVLQRMEAEGWGLEPEPEDEAPELEEDRGEVDEEVVGPLELGDDGVPVEDDGSEDDISVGTSEAEEDAYRRIGFSGATVWDPWVVSEESIECGSPPRASPPHTHALGCVPGPQAQQMYWPSLNRVMMA